MDAITRKFEFDAAHRVMHQTSKCKNLHGHRYVAEITYTYKDMQSIGYPIDFSDLKRVTGGFIDEYFDHGIILNPADKSIRELVETSKMKHWIMGQVVFPPEADESLFINPTAENIASELCRCLYALFSEHPYAKPHKVLLKETPNCWVENYVLNYAKIPADIYNIGVYSEVAYAYMKQIGGFKEYDERNLRNE